TTTLLPLRHVYYSFYLCYSFSLYPFTERYAQPYFFSCLIRQTFKTLCLLNYALMIRHDYDITNLADLDNNLVDSMSDMFPDEHALDYSFPSIFDEYDDDFFKVKSDTENVYDDPFDSKEEKIKESKLLIDELDLPCGFLPSEYDSFLSEDFSRVDANPQPTTRTRYLTQYSRNLKTHAGFCPPVFISSASLGNHVS
nr:hypothetical protein [Tanacetum cinerariifolium]